MRVSLNRVRGLEGEPGAEILVGDEVVSSIDFGYLLYVGLTHEDSEQVVAEMAEKIAKLRMMEDEAGRLGKNITQVEGAKILAVSSITLYTKIKKNRPGFSDAAQPEQALELFTRFVDSLREHGIDVKTGQFGADQDVKSTNWGPVTLQLDK